ncbi:MAG: branched-chain amino acid ABC transporter permease [Rhodocyclaceae bacterium]|nr:branched-chain amino acid ABC transporter permease [Rhodocyclaceae bacterium]
MLAQVLLSGIATGCVYGLVALSFVLVFKATETVSFMQGELLMLGAFAAVLLVEGGGWPVWLALPAAVLVLFAIGALLEGGVLRRALGQPHLTAVLLTFGLGLMLRGGVTMVPAATHQMHRLELPLAGVLSLGPLQLAGEHLAVVLATALACASLAAFFRFTRAGVALRACSEDARVAALMGISPTRMHTLAWALGAALAGFAGVLLAPVTLVHPGMGLIALKAFPAAVIGGLSSLPGALAGGVLVGVFEALTGLYLPDGAKDLAVYGLMLAVLLLFPRGLGGRGAAA